MSINKKCIKKHIEGERENLRKVLNNSCEVFLGF